MTSLTNEYYSLVSDYSGEWAVGCVKNTYCCLHAVTAFMYKRPRPAKECSLPIYIR